MMSSLLKPSMFVRSRFTFVIVLFIILTASCVSPEQTNREQLPDKDVSADVQVIIDTSRVIHVTDEKFLSISWPIGDLFHHWKKVNFSSVRLCTLARGLAPSYLRLGGFRANFAFFKEKSSLDSELSPTPTNFTFTGSDWDQINHFSQSVAWSFIFDVNDFVRRDNSWEPTNFKTLLDYNTRRGYRVTAWELGNEPNSYRSENVNISAEQVAADYIKLQDVLNSIPQYAKPFLIGPDIAGAQKKHHNATIAFLSRFLSKCGNCINVTTFHSYYLKSRTAVLDDFINPAILDNLALEIKEVRELIQKYRPHRPKIWLTETGDAVPGGVAGISDRYVGGFMFLDKLGAGAKYGLDAVMKQQFIGRNCGLVNDTNTNPRPVYWVAYIYKHLVGNRVLNVSKTPKTDSLRIYAHCTQTRHGKYSPGALTLIVINLDKTQSRQLTLQGALGDENLDEYLMTPSGRDGLHARSVNLNSVKLDMVSDTSFPKLKPRTLTNLPMIKLLPLTYGFYVIPRANLTICK